MCVKCHFFVEKSNITLTFILDNDETLHLYLDNNVIDQILPEN